MSNAYDIRVLLRVLLRVLCFKRATYVGTLEASLKSLCVVSIRQKRRRKDRFCEAIVALLNEKSDFLASFVLVAEATRRLR